LENSSEAARHQKAAQPGVILEIAHFLNIVFAKPKPASPNSN
jgi:hypothetical protein